MKAKPMLFSSDMVRALLAGKKTMTRRVVKPQPTIEATGFQWNPNKPRQVMGVWSTADTPPKVMNGFCPYGEPGDLIWVRETGWERPERTKKQMREGADTWLPYYYDADDYSEQDFEDFKNWGFRRRPSIHMPRWASRLTLKITNVRVERLLDISSQDAISEGASGGHGSIPGYIYSATPREHFSFIWESINGESSWAQNPWVWVVEFEVIQTNIDALGKRVITPFSPEEDDIIKSFYPKHGSGRCVKEIKEKLNIVRLRNSVYVRATNNLNLKSKEETLAIQGWGG